MHGHDDAHYEAVRRLAIGMREAFSRPAGRPAGPPAVRIRPYLMTAERLIDRIVPYSKNIPA